MCCRLKLHKNLLSDQFALPVVLMGVCDTAQSGISASNQLLVHTVTNNTEYNCASK